MEGPLESSNVSDFPVPLQLSRLVKDIQRKKATILNLQNTVYEAIAWMRTCSIGTVPVVTSDSGQQNMAAIQTIVAESFLKVLTERLADPSFTLAQFLSIPLSEFCYQRVPIVCPRMDIKALVHRMYRRQQDLLLVFDGIKFAGLVTAGDIFDAMIGTAVLDNAFFDVDMVNPSMIMENVRICCLRQNIAGIADRRVLRSLNPSNTLLTAIQTILNQSSPYISISSHPQKLHRIISARDILLGLLNYFEYSLPDESLSAELMYPLESVINLEPLTLTPDSSVLEAVEKIHFNNLTAAVILTEHQRIEGIVTLQTLLRAFLDTMNHA